MGCCLENPRNCEKLYGSFISWPITLRQRHSCKLQKTGYHRPRDTTGNADIQGWQNYIFDKHIAYLLQEQHLLELFHFYDGRFASLRFWRIVLLSDIFNLTSLTSCIKRRKAPLQMCDRRRPFLAWGNARFAASMKALELIVVIRDSICDSIRDSIFI